MPVDFFKCSVEIRELADEYYNHHIGFQEYREQRKKLIDEIDEEMNNDSINSAQDEDDSGGAKILNRILGLLKKDEKETSHE